MNTIHTDQLVSMLKQAGMRITPQRVAICDILSTSVSHPTATAIYDQLRDEYPTMSLATVYNTLDALVQLGAINMLGPIGDHTIHYDGDTTPHINLVCVSCKKIFDVDFPQLNTLATELENSLGYQILSSCLLCYGVCPDCQSA